MSGPKTNGVHVKPNGSRSSKSAWTRFFIEDILPHVSIKRHLTDEKCSRTRMFYRDNFPPNTLKNEENSCARTRSFKRINFPVNSVLDSPSKFESCARTRSFKDANFPPNWVERSRENSRANSLESEEDTTRATERTEMPTTSNDISGKTSSSLKRGNGIAKESTENGGSETSEFSTKRKRRASGSPTPEDSNQTSTRCDTETGYVLPENGKEWDVARIRYELTKNAEKVFELGVGEFKLPDWVFKDTDNEKEANVSNGEKEKSITSNGTSKRSAVSEDYEATSPKRTQH